MASNPQDLSELEKDPRLYLYTSLTAGSSHIVTATSRIETILKANRIPFAFIDTATNEKARKLWGRRAGKRKLPALIKEGFVIGDLEQVEEWNEFGELKEAIGPCPPAGAPVAPPPLPVKTTATAGTAKVAAPAPAPATSKAPATQQPIALPGAAEIAARNNPLPKSSPDDAAKPETMSSAPAEKEKSIDAAAALSGAKSSEAKSDEAKEQSSSKYDHLSAPASAIVSGTATPAEKKEDDKEEEKEAGQEGTAAAVSEADKAKYEHLSVPASAIQSGTATPAEPAKPSSEDTKESETSKAEPKVVNAPEEVKKVEKDTTIAEEPTKEATEKKEEEDVAAVAEGVEGMQVGEGKTVGEQEAKKAEDAVKSVED